MDWVGRRAGGIVMRFDPADAQVLRELVVAVRDMVAGGLPIAGSTDPLELLLGPGGVGPVGVPDGQPVDPALARLLPDGYRDDPDSAGEFRRLTESSLRRHKSETAQRVLDTLPAAGGRVCLDGDTTRAWLSALNDVRLVIGTRLDVTEDMDAPEPDDPAAPGYELYRWLTLLQELLVEATVGGSPYD
ncbi:MAG TPA: DUF2017 domain-containing protein [Mycobacteriales bacterium]|nr:DUF2017 domain-containing protein [Mycobacteriales bacterium]